VSHPGETAANFYDRVYSAVRQVPAGSVVTYGQVAVYLGSPAAARAVGYALHNLPPASDVPWWRVINAQGGVSHKGRGAQADRQYELLELEGVHFGPEGFTDLRRYRWYPGDEVEFD
jgi:methylated-DNA-protein-cysteine methyltransferase-like protein